MARISLVLLVLFSSTGSIDGTSYQCNTNSTCGCAAETTTVSARIVGGEQAADHSWGWIVSLQREGKHTCGASLIADDHVVTAAHCVYGIVASISTLSIVAGTNYLDQASSANAQRRTVEKITIHPNYNPFLYVNDIAVLHFSPLSISNDSNLAFICLPAYDQDPYQVNTDLVAIGWGRLTSGNGPVSNSLQQVTVKAFSSTSADCIRAPIVNTTVQFCAGISTGGKGTVSLGDHHFPLVFVFTLQLRFLSGGQWWSVDGLFR